MCWKNANSLEVQECKSTKSIFDQNYSWGKHIIHVFETLNTNIPNIKVHFHKLGLSIFAFVGTNGSWALMLS